jgi:hypothetical protein
MRIWIANSSNQKNIWEKRYMEQGAVLQTFHFYFIFTFSSCGYLIFDLILSNHGYSHRSHQPQTYHVIHHLIKSHDQSCVWHALCGPDFLRVTMTHFYCTALETPFAHALCPTLLSLNPIIKQDVHSLTLSGYHILTQSHLSHTHYTFLSF